MENIPIDWAAVDKINVAVLAIAVFVAAFLGNLLAMGSRFAGSLLTAILVAVFFVAWTYWLRDLAGPTFARPI